MRGTASRFSLLMKGPGFGLTALVVLLTASLITAIGLMVDDPETSVPLGFLAAVPAYLYVLSLRRKAERRDSKATASRRPWSIDPLESAIGPKGDAAGMAGTGVSWAECLLMGVVVFGALGIGGTLILLAALINSLRTDASVGDGFDPTVLTCAGASVAVVGVVTWRVVATRGALPIRGARAGLLVGLLAHPVCWVLFVGYVVAREAPPGDASIFSWLAAVVFGATWLTVSSVGMLGWITAPLGALLGYLAIHLRSAYPAPSGRRSEDVRGGPE